MFKIDPILGCKTNLAKFKRIQMIQIMFSEHYGIELEINKRKISEIFLDIYNLTNTYMQVYWLLKIN